MIDSLYSGCIPHPFPVTHTSHLSLLHLAVLHPTAMDSCCHSLCFQKPFGCQSSVQCMECGSALTSRWVLQWVQQSEVVCLLLGPLSVASLCSPSLHHTVKDLFRDLAQTQCSGILPWCIVCLRPNSVPISSGFCLILSMSFVSDSFLFVRS